MSIACHRRVILAVLITLCPAPIVGQGFGGMSGKFEVTFIRKRPPTVYLMGTDIVVRGTSQVAGGEALVPRITSALETDLLNHDPRLKRNAEAPQTTITCTITRLDNKEETVSRVKSESKKVGEHNEVDPKTGKTKTVDDYKFVDVTHTYKVVSGAMNVSYQVLNQRTQEVLDASNINGTFSQEYENGAGAPDQSGVHASLITSVKAQIVPRLVPTTESVRVFLAKDRGKLDPGDDLARAGLWTKALEAWSVMKPYDKPQDDAYRIYNIGVANEAIAYQTQELEQAQSFLEHASVNYGKALEMNLKEEYFREPQSRINSGITAYKKIAEQQATYARSLQQPPAPARPQNANGDKGLAADAPKETPKPSGVFGNDDVIALAKKGLDDQNLIATIKEQKAVKFDLSADGLGHLLDAKVSNPVIAAIRARQASEAGSAAKPAVATPKTGTTAAKPGTAAAKPAAPKTPAPTAPAAKPAAPAGGRGGGA